MADKPADTLRTFDRGHGDLSDACKTADNRLYFVKPDIIATDLDLIIEAPDRMKNALRVKERLVTGKIGNIGVQTGQRPVGGSGPFGVLVISMNK